MSKPSRSGFCPVLLIIAACMLLALPALADSQARIVRLSDVQGSVEINKNTGIGFERAFLNLPITQGAQVKTHESARAEIEFEDGSTMRLTPNTTVEFRTLAANDSGRRTSVVHLVEGMAYVNWLGKSGDEFGLNFSRETITLDHPAHFRVESSAQVADLAVFKGDVDVEGPNGKLVVEKKKTANFDVADNDQYKLAKNIEEAPLDDWDKQASEYHQQYAKNNASSPYAYGLSDLNYYGAFTNVAGYGMLWQPYFAGMGWDPFLDGAWAFYPGFGYMFASAYPWGWMPYHYGSWVMVPGMGWMWNPGMAGGWTWTTVPRYAGTLPANFHAPVAPPSGRVNTVVMGRSAIASPSMPSMSSRVVLNAGSAGMGIPRGSLNNLHQLNHQVARSGSAQVRPAPQFSTTPTARNEMMTRQGYGPQGYGAAGPGGASAARGASAPRGSMASPAPASRTSSAPAVHSAPSGGPHR